jgi:hypothetical protein
MVKYYVLINSEYHQKIEEIKEIKEIKESIKHIYFFITLIYRHES